MNDRIAALHARQSGGERLEFLFFWGHTGRGPGPWALSQWWEAPFVVDGVTFRTAEHWMMAQKALLFEDEASFARIVAALKPSTAKTLGRGVRDFDEAVWAEARFPIVRTGNVEKFRQNPELRDWLLATGEAILVEASPPDRVWGIGRAAHEPNIDDVTTWRGENLLGFALAEARDRLRRFPEPRLGDDAVMPPWITFPGEHPCSICWRMGGGEDHLATFGAWWRTLTPDERVQVELLYPAQGPWARWYEQVG